MYHQPLQFNKYHKHILTWFMIVLNICSVLTTVMFLSWAWLGAAETWTHSDLPDTVSSSHLMLKSLMAFLMFLAMIVARGLLLPAVESSLEDVYQRNKGNDIHIQLYVQVYMYLLRSYTTCT